jgi:hypothetical protein
MSRWLDNVPHACFKANFLSALSAKEEISGLLESHLRARFGAAERGLLWRWGAPRLVRLHVGQRLVSVVWHKNRFADGEWILVVAPGDMPMPWDKFRGRNAVLWREELMLVSRDIHALLDSATGITNVMWYFDEFRRQGGTAVRTPDELPWAET